MAQPNPTSFENEQSSDLTRVESEGEIRTLIDDASDLPPADRIIHLRTACESISGLNLPAKKTMQLVEQCREVSIETIRDLNQSYFGLTLPLQPKQEMQVNNTIILAQSMEAAYAVLGKASADSNQGLILHRRLELLLEQFVFSATAYTPWAKGLWARMHQVFAEANSRNVTKFKPAPSANEREPRSLRNLYAIAVLTGSADPYQMPYRDTQKVRELSASLLDRVKILAPGKLPGTGNSEPVCLLADPRIDKPALPHRTGKPINQHASLLDISKALAHLKKRLTVLEHDPSVVDPLFEKEPRNNVTALYRHLIIKWGWQPIRGATRNTVNLDFDLVAGFDRILQELEWNPTLTSTEDLPDKHAAALPEEPVDFDDDEEEIVMEGDSIVMSGNVGGSWRTDDDESSDSEFCYATSIDVSETGLGLRLPAPPDTGLRVGEILCVRERAVDQHWTMGVVRWVKSVSGGELEIGVLKIPGIPQYAQLRSVELVRNAELQKDGSDVESLQVLVATDAESRQGRLRARLIVPGRDGNVESVSWLSFSGTDRTVDSMKRFLSTRYVSCYSCKLSVPRKMPTMNTNNQGNSFAFR